jgi:pimeloyl-ACP methyl ester carboxylesterase
MPFLDPRRSAQGRFAPLAMLPYAHRLAAWRMASIPKEEMLRMVVAACFADPDAIPEQRRVEASAEIELRYTVPWYADAYVRSLRGLVLSFVRAYLPGANSLWRIARQIVAPTLVIGADRDLLIDVRVAPQVARVIPDSRLLMLGNVGHVAQVERPALVARAVLGLLDEIGKDAAPASANSGEPTEISAIIDPWGRSRAR